MERNRLPCTLSKTVLAVLVNMYLFIGCVDVFGGTYAFLFYIIFLKGLHV